jgi:hypothetical protein
MFPRNKNRIAAAVVLTGVLALVPVAPAGAAGWPVWGDAHVWVDGLLPRALVWLGLTESRSTAPTCDHGSQIDPNGGCTKAVVNHGASIDPNGMSTDHGSSIDPNG